MKGKYAKSKVEKIIKIFQETEISYNSPILFYTFKNTFMKKIYVLALLLLVTSCNKPAMDNTPAPTDTPLPPTTNTEVPTPSTPADPNAVVKAGDKVEVHYKGTLEDGTVFDESYTRKEPLPFTVGGGQMIKGFDAAVVGMKVGDKKTVTLAPADAYGERNAESTVMVPKEQLGDTANTVKVGDKLYDQYGRSVTVLEITEKEVKVDTNHELAGKTLIFDIEMMKIN